MKQTYGIIGAILVTILAIVGWRYYASTLPGQYDTFAQCLTEKGAVFYGAWWCPHCENMKELFGNSMKYVTYVECSTTDGKSQLPACVEKEIKGYPTWIFADGSRETGELPFEMLSEKTGCTLPEGV
jgi:ribosomal protein S27E